MNINAGNLIDNYYKWLKDQTAWKEIEDFVEITTPYLDRHNDYIQIYLKQDGDGYILTDDSYTIEDLEMSGCPLDSPKRQKLLTVTLNGFGVKKDKNNLFVKATKENFAVNKHNFIQAILAVNDMFYLARATVTNIFLEDVQMWLRASEIRFTERVSFIGHSGYSRHFDFVIPESTAKPERIIQTVNNPTRDKAEQMVFGWLDTKDLRSRDSMLYLAVNNTEKEVPKQFKEATSAYGINLILWDKRDESIPQLVA